MDTLNDRGISHFIPSVQLTGSREEKLRKLDMLIHHLQQVRRALSSSGTAQGSLIESYDCTLRPWRAFTAGLLTGVTFALFAGAVLRWLL